jgi:hypothetical protein
LLLRKNITNTLRNRQTVWMLKFDATSLYTSSAATSVAEDDEGEVPDTAPESAYESLDTQEPYKKNYVVPWSRDLIRKKFNWMVTQQKTPMSQTEDMLSKGSNLRKHLKKSRHLQGQKLTRAVRDKLRSFFRWVKEYLNWIMPN